MKKLSKLVSLMLSVVLCIGMAAPAFAIEYQVDVGRVYIENDESGKAVSWQENHATHNSKETASDDKEIVITGTYTEEDKMATGNRVTVGENVKDTTITLRDVNIDASISGHSAAGFNYEDDERPGEAALSITGAQSDVTVKVEGTNILKSGADRAGLELKDGASVIVDGAGTLTATGGDHGAGIGSGCYGTAGNITISGSGNVTATGGEDGAGIGSGNEGSVGNITISGSGSVTATSKEGGAGIGSGGSRSTAGNITISTNGSGTVTAKGGFMGAGIGSGHFYSTAGNITISTNDRSSVTAKSGGYGAGIGSGENSSAGNITICCGAKVTAKGYNNCPNIGRGHGGRVGTITQNPSGDHNYKVETNPATCTEDGVTTYTCGICGHSYKETIPAGHSYDDGVVTKEATCTEDGEKTYTCVKGDHSYTEVIPANGHGEGVWTVTNPARPGVPGVESLICPDCGEVLDTREIPALPIPAIPDTGADAAPDTAATIADQEVPLAGLMPLYMLLEELRQHEEIPEIELPEDFKWIDHEYAQAIYWGLQEELVVDTEEEPLDPDEVITVALLREVLVNFVEYKGADLAVTLEGEDDEIVFDLGERLAAFYAELEASLKAQETKAA